MVRYIVVSSSVIPAVIAPSVSIMSRNSVEVRSAGFGKQVVCGSAGQSGVVSNHRLPVPNHPTVHEPKVNV